MAGGGGEEELPSSLDRFLKKLSRPGAAVWVKPSMRKRWKANLVRIRVEIRVKRVSVSVRRVRVRVERAGRLSWTR